MIPRKVCVCTDFSENSVPARVLASELAKAFDGELLILHVVNSRFVGYPTFEDRLPVDLALLQKNIEEGVKEELELLANDSSRVCDRVSAHYRVGDPAEEITRFAEENSVELLVMGTHGWTGIKHLILGSVAERVVRMARCPVLTVRSTLQE